MTPPSAGWISLRIAAPPELADAVANFLIERGASGVLSDDGAPGESALEAALPAATAASVRGALDRWLASLAIVEPRAREVRVTTAPADDVDWTAVARRHHRPLLVGRRLVVAPPWDLPVPAPPDRELLVIEPGMAFGTGQHATTRACLEAIEAALARSRIDSALDVGTGSGILAIALARLGVARVVALDTDPAVLPLARANLRQNAAGRVALVGGSPAALRARFDLVVANLLADAIVAEAAALARAVATRGRLVLSGLVAAQTEAVRAAYPGWRLAEERAEDDWRTLTLEREG